MAMTAAGKRHTSVLVASDWAPIRAFDRPMRDDPASVYGELLPVLRRADLRIVNCECALTTCREPVWKSGSVFKGDPAHVTALTAVPFDVACLANNHVLDYGVRGLRDTLAVLHRHGIRTVGAGLTEEQAHEPLTCRSNGVAIHIVNFSEGEDLTAAEGGPGVFGWDIPRVLAEIRRRRGRGGRVIAIGHCGLEYIPYPPPYVVAAFRAMVDAGADCVIGHHPHVPQGIEWRHDRPIVYSLGNFAFYQHTDLYWRRTGASVTIRFDGDKVADLDVHPYRISETGLRVLDRKEDAAFRRTLARLSRPFTTLGGPEQAWQSYLSYYGMAGFSAEVSGILDRMKTEPRKGAAMFRNRITTMQHVELWRDLLTRMIVKGRATGRLASRTRVSSEARTLVEEFFTRIVTPQD
jgi:poly-gamma-glutamate capsule biosynthesis protein CapA/YwtB (metallophosphatase superfamily)